MYIGEIGELHVPTFPPLSTTIGSDFHYTWHISDTVRRDKTRKGTCENYRRSETHLPFDRR